MHPYGDDRPRQSSREGIGRQSSPEAKQPHPGVNVAASSNKSKTAVEWPQFIELFPKPDMPGIVEQVVEQIARHQATTNPPPLCIVRAGDKKDRYGKIPRMFHEKIEHM